jgi:hypothetical protein
MLLLILQHANQQLSACVTGTALLTAIRNEVAQHDLVLLLCCASACVSPL